ncbi:tetratricopeptide repeat protein [Puia sp.]|uniref:tetratricopeptide repeat protein n=1 Tax=Puia sp. TaxID=2045100 RepID=UPI002F421133
MSKLSPVLLFVAAFFTIGRAAAQDSLSIRDASEIRYKAERMVKTELNELLNSLSNTSYETQEVAESIHSSYTESRNRIFRDSLVLVEPDINPAIRNSSQSGDEPLGKYLRDIDLLYKKTDSATVEFNNIRSSPVKKKENIYVKVYFNSRFKGQSAISGQPYSMTNRIAEIKAERDKNQWRLFIVRLAFFNPADTVADVANNIPLKHETPVLTGLTGRSTAQDTVAAIQRQQTFDEEQSERITRQLREQERLDDERYKRLLVLGDGAYRQKDFTGALKYFTDAQQMRPNSPEVNARLKNTSNSMNEFKVESAELYAGFIEKARLQENSRQYKEAIESYQNAIRVKPNESANLQPHIRQLTDKFVILSDLQEKYNAGYVKDALREYTEAIKKDPNNSDYYLGRGRCHEKLTDEPKNLLLALQDYSKAYDLDHNNLSAIRYRAELYANMRDYFKALSDYKVYLTIDRNNIEMYERKSAMHVQLKLYSEAIADLDEALTVDPKAAHVYLTKGMLLMMFSRQQDVQQDIRKASDNFTTCLRIDSNNAQALFNRGRCDILLGRLPDAAADFTNARSKGLDTANLRIIALYAANYYNVATAQFTRKDMDSALRYIDYAISIEPQSALYRFTRGDYCYSLGDHKEAIASYDLAIRYNPVYIQAFYKRGMARYGLDQYKEAINDLDTALKLDPQNLLALKGKGDALRAQKDHSGAAEAYENALRIATSGHTSAEPALQAELYNNLGYCYFEMGEYERTIANEKKAIAADRNYADAYFNRGYAYFHQGQLPDAIDDLTKAISLLDKHPEWHYVLGRAYLDKKEFTNAATQFAVYLQKDKEQAIPDAIYRQGYCNYMLQNYTVALPFYSRSLALHLDTAQSSFPVEMGVVYLNTGKYDSAYYYCHKAYQRDSTNGWASYGIGSSLALQGKADESIVWFERSFRKRTPSYAEIKRDRLLANMRDNNKKFKELLKKYF